MAIPEADPKAVARMQWEKENRVKAGVVSKSTGFLRRGPDMSSAARSGTPAMTTIRPSVPMSVPQTGAPGFTGDVTATTVSDPTALDTQPDARANPPDASKAAAADSQSTQQSASDQQSSSKKKKKKEDKKPKQSSSSSSTSSSSSKP